MVRLYSRPPLESSGKLIVEELHPNCVEVFFIPPAEKLEALGYSPDQAEKYKTQILLISGQNDYVSIFPINTLTGHKDFLKPKYTNIESITLDGFGYETPETTEAVMEILEDFPPGFVKDYDYGLGLQKDYRFIIDAVDEIGGIKHISISTKEKTGIDMEDADDNSGMFIINFKDYNTIRKSIIRINSRAQSTARKMKSITAYNGLAYFLDSPKYPQKTYRAKNDTLHKMISDGEDAELSKSDQDIVINLIYKNTPAIAETQPEKLIKLHDNIELLTLAQLIETFGDMFRKELPESRWQKLFNDNPFILNLAFGYPVIKIQDQAHVGGRKIEGSGDKITDFLVKNGISNNAALFEIKTPATPLLNVKPYRDGVYTPSAALAGAINQMLDQKSRFQQEIASIKNNSRIYDLESYAVHGVLVIGRTPEDLDKQKSFELFRGNSKDISIITFDELLEKLRQLHTFLSSDEKEGLQGSGGKDYDTNQPFPIGTLPREETPEDGAPPF